MFSSLNAEKQSGSQALFRKLDYCGNGSISPQSSEALPQREGPFLVHIGLTTPRPTWPQIPVSSPGRGAGCGLKWGRWNARNASCSDRPTVTSLTGAVTAAACEITSEPKSLHFSQF